MGAERVGVPDDAIARFLGDELRRARTAIGLTRAQLIERLPNEIHPQTLASYESGTRQCTVARLVMLCDALEVTAPDILTLALQRAEQALSSLTLRVDLNSLIRDQTAEFDGLRTWAQRRLEVDPDGSDVASLEPAAVREMAVIFSISRTKLAGYLARFAPTAAPHAS